MNGLDLCIAPAASRVVIRLADGTEVDVDRADHFCGVIVLTPAVGLVNADRLPDLEDLDRVIEVARVASEFDGLDAGKLRMLLESSTSDFDEMAAMLSILENFGCTTREELQEIINVVDCEDAP